MALLGEGVPGKTSDPDLSPSCHCRRTPELCSLKAAGVCSATTQPDGHPARPDLVAMWPYKSHITS